MEPTILTGDYITTRNLTVGGDPTVIHRGDIVVHTFPPDPRKVITKRVIGVPGDTLEMKDGVVFIDGRALREAYAQHVDSTDPVVDDFNWQRPYLVGAAMRDSASYEASRDSWGPLVVPRGRFFVLGDNRTRSLDSRYFGFVAASQVRARARRISLLARRQHGTDSLVSHRALDALMTGEQIGNILLSNPMLRRFLRVVIATSCIPLASLAAQSSVIGTVTDSVNHHPLAGAMIQLANDSAKIVKSATSDSLGGFRIDSLAPGSYIIGFFHPTLDSLGLDLLPRA